MLKLSEQGGKLSQSVGNASRSAVDKLASTRAGEAVGRVVEKVQSSAVKKVAGKRGGQEAGAVSKPVQGKAAQPAQASRSEKIFWTKTIRFKGNKVFQRNDLIDPKLVDPKTGLTNLELMRRGRSPIGPDAKPVNLHHMIQTSEGAIAEVTQTFHRQNSRVIHVNSSNIPSGIDRVKFSSWRSDYWKSRAKDF